MSNPTPTEHTEAQFEAALTAWLDGAQQRLNRYWKEQGFTYAGPPTLSVQRNPRWYRVVRTDAAPGTGRSVHAFIDPTNGDVLFAGSWKGPQDKRPRGNLFDAQGGLGMVGPHGVRTLR